MIVLSLYIFLTPFAPIMCLCVSVLEQKYERRVRAAMDRHVLFCITVLSITIPLIDLLGDHLLVRVLAPEASQSQAI